MLRFLISIVSLSAILAGLFYSGFSLGFFPLPSFLVEIILYSAISTALIFYLLKKRMGAILFTQTYLLTIVLKILTGSIFILIVIFIDHAGAQVNAGAFVASYLLFTLMEVIFLYGNVSRQR